MKTKLRTRIVFGICGNDLIIDYVRARTIREAISRFSRVHPEATVWSENVFSPEELQDIATYAAAWKGKK